MLKQAGSKGKPGGWARLRARGLGWLGAGLFFWSLPQAGWALTHYATIQGVVVDASNNSVPCDGVAVQFDPFTGNTIFATTDALGRYVFENLPITGSSPHQLLAVKTGYAVSFDFYPSPPLAEDGSNTINVSLYRGCTLTGSVVDAKSNSPLANIKITAAWPGIHALVMGVTYTASDGTFALPRIHAGVNDLLVTDPLYATVQRLNVLCPDQAMIGPYHFSLRPGGSLSGVVRDFQSNPQPNAVVRVYPDNGNAENIYETLANTAGGYAFSGMPTGGYSLRVIPPTGANLQIMDVGGITVQQLPAAIRDFSLQPGGSLSGTVRWPSGVPAAGVYVWVCTDAQYPFNSDFSQITDSLGAYQINGLSPDQSYTVMAFPITNTACAIALKRHVTAAENTLAYWNVTLGIGGGRQGTVLGPAGLPVYPAEVLALNGQLGLPRNTTPTTGAYALANLPAGDYYFGVLPDATANLQPLVGTMQINAGETGAFSVSLAAGGCLEGYVTSTAGTPLMDVKVSARDPHSPFAASPGFELSSFTDETGHYRIQGLSTGPWDVQVNPDLASLNGFSPCFVKALPMTAGATVTRNFELVQDGLQVKGTVRDQSGNRIMNAMVQFWSEADPTLRGLAATNLQGTYTLMLKPSRYQAQAYYMNLLGNNLADTPRTLDLSQTDFTSWTQDFTLQTGATWAGQVQDTLGRFVHLAQVRAYAEASNLPALTALTHERGDYEVLGLSSGAYALDIQAPGYAPFQTTISPLIGNRTLNQNYTLVALNSIAGTVASGGAPLGGAQVQVLDTAGVIAAQTATLPNGAYLAEPLAGGPYQVKVSAVGLKSQTQTGVYPGSRADFSLEPLIGHDEAISYPNPCRGKLLTFLFWLDNDATVLIRVYNQAGELVWDWEGPGIAGGYNKQAWPVDGVAPGVYLYKITARESNGSQRSFPSGKLTVIK